MFYLIGLGLNEKSLTAEALVVIEKCNKIYLENYTIKFPYSLGKLEELIGKKIIQLNREQVEGEEFLNEAKKQDVVLLVYGSPLAATTHVSLLLKCKKEKIKASVLQNASIFDAVAETGLQLYKFGKTASLPKWQAEENYKPESFVELIKDNLKINAHTLILVDIGLSFEDALQQIEHALNINNIKINKIVVCSCLGTDKSKILYDSIENLKKSEKNKLKKISGPFCFVLPAKLHFLEEEALNKL